MVRKREFRGKFRFSLCKWFRIQYKKPKIISNDDFYDSDLDSDWDDGNLINNNKPIIVYRRPPVFQLFKK